MCKLKPVLRCKRFTDLLKNLVKYGYLAKEGNEYKIPDPVVMHACKLANQSRLLIRDAITTAFNII